ncbi:MAG: 4Fe-4S binding protein [Acidimicrobiales bacterium]
MTAAVTIDGRCTACGMCIATCPEGALSTAPARPRVETDACTSCWECLEICPVDAISGCQ